MTYKYQRRMQGPVKPRIEIGPSKLNYTTSVKLNEASEMLNMRINGFEKTKNCRFK